jgi:hypothetical protein
MLFDFSIALVSAVTTFFSLSESSAALLCIMIMQKNECGYFQQNELRKLKKYELTLVRQVAELPVSG